MNINLKYLLDETRHTYSNGTFNHCSTLLSHNDAVYLAWYSGIYECSKEQCVTLLNINTGMSMLLESGSGNPVLFKDKENRAFILYSVFQHHKNIENNIDKWKYCNLYIREIFEDHLSDRVLIADETQHLLGRCVPTLYNGQVYLPLYDELDGKCVIFGGNGFNYRKTFEFGEDEIQPAIYHDGIYFRALTRNFKSKRTKARLHIKTLHNFYEVEETDIPNNNSSIAILSLNDLAFVVYNDSEEPLRKNLTIGYIADNKFTRIKMIDAYGHYPSIIRHNEEFIISYTSFYSTIKVLRLNINSFLNECGYYVKMQ